jgi:biotin transport system substrate-specific component
MTSQALVPIFISRSNEKLISNILSVMMGVGLIALLAQVAIPLPWTPVPITGQTFGVALVALSWGRARGLATVATYFILGGLGLPIFASAASGFSVGPTMGYLIGMVIASFVVGGLADKGWTKTLGRSLAAAFIGSLCIFGCGLFVLSFFVPKEMLLMSGLIPFIPGDILKNTTAAIISNRSRKLIR